MECPSCRVSLPEEALFCLRCGGRAPDRTKAEREDPVRSALVKALGQQYEIGRLLGRGGMGAVYLATEAALEREVAIKVLPPDRGATQDSRDRFRREARTAAKLSHPNIVPLHTFGEVDGTLYFVMGYVKGESLAARLKREGRLPVEGSRRILIEIADALDYAHKLGVIHRDIKPDNVLLEEATGRALLMDFGVAKALGVGQTMTEVGSVLGTPHYMSPEQAQGKADIDHRTDLYSLGVMGYAMFAGRLPFEGPTPGDIMVQHITKEAPALKSLAPEVPVEIATALTRCLAKKPGERWSDARSLRLALEEHVQDGIPEDMRDVARGTQIMGLGLYLSLLAGVHFASRTVDPDPAGLTPWHFILFFAAVSPLDVVLPMVRRRKDGRSWAEILRFACAKPSWWIGAYPGALRLPHDVWKRLPADLRRGRARIWAFALWCALVMPPLSIVKNNSANTLLSTGHRSSADIALRQFRPVLLPVFLAPLFLLAAAFLSYRRWGRSLPTPRDKPELLEKMAWTDTARRTFWSKPEVAALLLPESPDPARGGRVAPTSARDLVSAISTAVSRLTGESQALGERARETALDLARAIAGLDGEITSLEGAVDPVEADRLIAKIAALGPPSPNEGGAKSQMRDLFQKQLALQCGVADGLHGLKALRLRKLELLGALWFQVSELRSESIDASHTRGTAERLRKLCAEIAQPSDGSSVTRPFGQEAIEGISDSPTIERK